MQLKEIHTKIEELAERFGLHAGVLYGAGCFFVVLFAAAIIGIFASAGGDNTAHPSIATTSDASVSLADSVREHQAPAHAATTQPPPHVAAPMNASQEGGQVGHADAPVAADMQDPVMPGADAPADLVPMRAAYTLESAPTPGYNETAVNWSRIGRMMVDARAANFVALQQEKLDDLLPSKGQVRETWQFSVHVPKSGDWVTVARATGAYRTVARLFVDGVPQTALTSRPDNAASTHVGTLRLGAGWHEVRVTLEQRISRPQSQMKAHVELFWRGPGDSSPVAMVPHAVDAGAKKLKQRAIAKSAPPALTPASAVSAPDAADPAPSAASSAEAPKEVFGDAAAVNHD